MCYQLRIKIKELTGEVKANKFEQQKMLKKAKISTLKQVESLRRRYAQQSNDLIIMRRMYSTPTGQLIRQIERVERMGARLEYLENKISKRQISEEHSAKLRHDAADARDHLLKKVRPELRATNIAYGYIKGRSYVEMEGLHNLFAGKWNVHWHRVAAMVYSYGSQEAKDNFPAWLENIGIKMERTEVKKGQFVYKFYQTEKFVTKVAA